MPHHRALTYTPFNGLAFITVALRVHTNGRLLMDACGAHRMSNRCTTVYDPCTAHILARNSLALFLAQNMRDWKGLNKPAFRR